MWLETWIAEHGKIAKITKDKSINRLIYSTESNMFIDLQQPKKGKNLQNVMPKFFKLYFSDKKNKKKILKKDIMIFGKCQMRKEKI